MIPPAPLMLWQRAVHRERNEVELRGQIDVGGLRIDEVIMRVSSSTTVSPAMTLPLVLLEDGRSQRQNVLPVGGR